MADDLAGRQHGHGRRVAAVVTAVARSAPRLYEERVARGSARAAPPSASGPRRGSLAELGHRRASSPVRASRSTPLAGQDAEGGPGPAAAPPRATSMTASSTSSVTRHISPATHQADADSSVTGHLALSRAGGSWFAFHARRRLRLRREGRTAVRSTAWRSPASRSRSSPELELPRSGLSLATQGEPEQMRGRAL